MAYTRVNWQNSPSHATPLSAENLNVMDAAIEELDGAVTDAEGTISTLGSTVSYQATTISGLQTTVGEHTADIGNMEDDISDLQTTVSGHTTSIGNLQTTVSGHTTSIGTLASLTTTEKSNLVGAINEVNEDVSDVKEELSENVGDLKSQIEIIEPNTQCYPPLYRGTVNVNTGEVFPNPSTLNRLFSVPFSTASYDRIRTKVGINAYVIYYNSDMTYAGNSAGFKTNDIILNQTYPIARVMLANSDSSDFSEVITDGVLLYNSSRSCLIGSHFEDIMTATDAEKTLYSHTAASTNFSHTIRWFVPQSAPPNSIIKDIHVYSGGGGTLTVELWKKNKTTFTRVASYSFVTAAEATDAKNVFAIGYKTGDNEIYISMHGSWGAVLKGSVGNSSGVLILRDVSSASFSESSLENMRNYLMAVDVNYYSLPTNRTYRIGQYDNVAEIITEALKYMDSTVYIEPYVHDCVQEWEAYFGDGYWDNFSSGRGIELKNNIHIIGRSGCVLQCHYTGNNDFVQSDFSLFNNCDGGSGYTIENVIFDTSKIRYVIHDERGSDTTPYKVRYSRCQMSQDNSESTWDRSRACIGGGLGAHGDVVVEDCVFDTVVSTGNKDSIAYHNSESGVSQSTLIIKNCYCKGDSTLQLASYGSSTKKTMVMVANCSFGSEVEELDWTGGTPNFDIHYINNEIRSN